MGQLRPSCVPILCPHQLRDLLSELACDLSVTAARLVYSAPIGSGEEHPNARNLGYRRDCGTLMRIGV
jgi:hypothetical protein